MLLSSAMQAPAVTQGLALARPVSQVPLAIANDVSVLGVPNPKTAIVIKGITAYTVPTGKLLVLSALGFSGVHADASVAVLVDGTREVKAYSALSINSLASPTSLTALPSLVTVAAGSAVALASAVSTTRAWGYLSDA